MSDFERVEDMFQGVIVTLRLARERPIGTRPSFNVCVPFPEPTDYEMADAYPNKRGVTIVQMNKAMADALVEFIDPAETQELDPHLRELCEAFVSDDGTDKSKISFEPQFRVCREFNGVVIVMLNSLMVDIIIRFIKQVENDGEEIDTIFYALRSALINPARSREIRQQKREEREAANRDGNGRKTDRRERDYDEDEEEFDDRRRRPSYRR